MHLQIIFLAVAIFCHAHGRPHPIEMKMFSNLREEILDSELSNESAVPDAIIEEHEIFVYPGIYDDNVSIERIACINLGNDGCVNGSIVGSGGDGGFLVSGRNPGK